LSGISGGTNLKINHEEAHSAEYPVAVVIETGKGGEAKAPPIIIQEGTI